MQVKRNRKSEPGDADEPSKTEVMNTVWHTQEQLTNATLGGKNRQRKAVESKTRRMKM